MKRFLLTVSIAIVSAAAASAQTDLSYRYWTEGPLTVDEFPRRKANDEIIGQIASGIETCDSDWEKVKWNLRVKRVKSKTLFDPLRSWIANDDSLAGQALRYAQLQYDATELTRRQMQNYLATEGYKTDYRFAIERHFHAHQALTEEIEMLTDKGKDATALAEQEALIAARLAELPEDNAAIPEYTLRKLGLGMYIGATSQFYVGGAADIFGPGYGMALGVTAAIGRSEITWDCGFGGGYRLKADMNGYEQKTWNAGSTLMNMETTFQYSYAAYDGNTFKISPFAGIGIGMMEYTSPNSELEDKTDSHGGLRLVAGASIELKYLRSLYLVSDMVWSSIYGGINEHSLKLKVYVARDNYLPASNPYSINCALTFNLMSKYMQP